MYVWCFEGHVVAVGKFWSSVIFHLKPLLYKLGRGRSVFLFFSLMYYLLFYSMLMVWLINDPVMFTWFHLLVESCGRFVC
jgi:hypothetical protein